FRVLAATHRDLEAMVEEGTFRRDLLYRLNAMPLKIPPLRERRRDIAPLAQRFLQEASGANGRPIHGFEEAAIVAPERYAWPGNVREIRNAIERAVVIAQHSFINCQDLPERVADASGETRRTITDHPVQADAAAEEPADGPSGRLRTAVDRFER